MGCGNPNQQVVTAVTLNEKQKAVTAVEKPQAEPTFSKQSSLEPKKPSESKASLMSQKDKTTSQIESNKGTDAVTALSKQKVAKIADQIEQTQLEKEQEHKEKQLEADAPEPKLYFRTCFGGISK